MYVNRFLKKQVVLGKKDTKIIQKENIEYVYLACFLNCDIQKEINS